TDSSRLDPLRAAGEPRPTRSLARCSETAKLPASPCGRSIGPQGWRGQPSRDSPISHALSRAPRTGVEAAVPSAEDRFHSVAIYQTGTDDERCVDTNASRERGRG